MERDKSVRMNADVEKELVELLQRVKDQHAEISSLKEVKTAADEELRKLKEQNSQLEAAVKPLVNALVLEKNPAIAAQCLLRLSTSGARSTSPRRLILACESKNTSKNKKECNQFADE